MLDKNNPSNLTVVLGLGKTGLSCIRYLAQRNVPVAVMDSRQQPPMLASLKKEFPTVAYYCGELKSELLDAAATIVVSPGLALQTPAIAKQIAAGKEVIGDIELFARHTKAPICAITGSNAKSTVTAWVGAMAKAAKLDVRVGGNIGMPTLDLLQDSEPDLFVLELSSFQLETTYSLHAKVATILNLTPDHMDRYVAFADYRAAKQRIYHDCDIAVINRDDPYTLPEKAAHCSKIISFGADKPQVGEFGIVQKNKRNYLAYDTECLLVVDELKRKGKHHWLNALAALALGSALNLPLGAMIAALKSFTGLPHRCQYVGQYAGIAWINDSKGTNVGATVAAIEGLGRTLRRVGLAGWHERVPFFGEPASRKGTSHDRAPQDQQSSSGASKLILIAGGLAKGADFTALAAPIQNYVRSVVLLGQDAAKIAAVVSTDIDIKYANTMQEAVALAKQSAKPGDTVLLSPACASFDMFQDFMDRGEQFMTAVKGLAHVR